MESNQMPDPTPDQTTPAETDFTRAEDAPQGSGSYGSGYGLADEGTDTGQNPAKPEDDSTEESEEVTEEESTEAEEDDQPGSTPGTGVSGGPAY